MARRPKNPPGPFIIREEDMADVDAIMDEIGIPVHDTIEETLTYLAKQSGGIPSFVQDILRCSGEFDEATIRAADQAGRNHRSASRPARTMTNEDVFVEPARAQFKRPTDGKPVDPDDDFGSLDF